MSSPAASEKFTELSGVLENDYCALQTEDAISIKWRMK